MESKTIPASEKPDCIFFFDGTKKRAYKKKRKLYDGLGRKRFTQAHPLKEGFELQIHNSDLFRDVESL